MTDILDRPTNESSREAQALLGEAWVRQGNVERARREFELFLTLYPSGADSTRVMTLLAQLPAKVAAAPPNRSRGVPTTSAVVGSVGAYYFGGQSKVRSEEFKDSPLSGLPELVQNPTLSGVDQRLLSTNVDLNYRHRTAEDDVRFVFRDVHQANLMPGRADRNRLTALYVDYRSLTHGTAVRLGRQSPTGGGVMSRFDGVQASYAWRPKWKASVVAGVPVDALAQTKRDFYGASVDADALTENVGGSVYINHQRIDGYVDRQAFGFDLRYYKEGTFVSSNVDYDLALRTLNVLAVNGMWQQLDNDGHATVTVNALFDRRAQPLATLGNALFFSDPSGGLMPSRMDEALALRDLDTLRTNVRETTAFSTQALLGVTVPVNKHWQLGGDIRLTRVDAIRPVSVILPYGQPATGNVWGLGAQLIGSNLYSDRDTHVLTASVQRAPQAQPFDPADPLLATMTPTAIPGYTGVLLAYHNVSTIQGGWQIEPNVQFYRQTSTAGLRLTRIKPGMRVSWRFMKPAVVEASADYEITRTTSPSRSESANRFFYYLGTRYEF